MATKNASLFVTLSEETKQFSSRNWSTTTISAMPVGEDQVVLRTVTVIMSGNPATDNSITGYEENMVVVKDVKIEAGPSGTKRLVSTDS
ncbi:MAG: hypothetical protein CL678_16005 [Bdellovibrionaceae bacterium]|nr:hypothetical protein [Pseudobdellovibrionaceae bacterium]|tara:strand:- start:562 stop:828 length:267 start_codon:yes stop_codon:yes gene_type:complete